MMHSHGVERPLRGVLIGCGFFSDNHLHAWRELGVEIAAVCDIDRQKAEATVVRHGIGRTYIDADQMLATERPDFVDIVTTVGSHRQLVELAASRGVAAICQKPFAETLADADTMILACERAGVPLMVHENFRWREPMLNAARAIDEGRIGTPFFGRISCRHDFDVYGTQPYLAEVKRFAILDVGVHLLDLARFYFGEVEEIACTTQRVNPAIVGEDVATMLLRHSSGATSIVDASFFTHMHPTPFPQATLEFDGMSGALRVEEGYRLRLSSGQGVADRSVEPAASPWMQKPWHDVQRSVVNIQRHWLECLRSGAAPATSGRDNRRSMQLTLLAYEAAESRSVVRVPA